MKNPKDVDQKPSEMFMEAMSGFGVGSPDLTCGWCNRLHLCPDASCYKDEEDGSWKEYCEEEKQRNPDNVVLHYDWDAISGHTINNILFVDDCPCNGITRYETFIWGERNIIRTYLKARIEQEYRWAEEELTLNKLAGI